MSLSCSSSSSIKEGKEVMATAANKDENSHVAVKGKRTKRPRNLSPSPTAPMITATSSSSVSSSSAEFSGSTITEEEEDMANCLILLAQGRALMDPQAPQKFTYECKTCNKCFPTFQALGGHRASHKKPKIAATIAAAPPINQEKKVTEDHDEFPTSTASFVKPITTTNSTIIAIRNTQKVHECSICGLEFTSGQALGGHMRRHRSAPVTEPIRELKEKNLLSLDLNLPAPDEDDGGDIPKSQTSKALFSFATKQQPILLAPSALVDCHY